MLVRDADPPETTWLGDLTEQCCGVPLLPGPGRMSQPWLGGAWVMNLRSSGLLKGEIGPTVGSGMQPQPWWAHVRTVRCLGL